MTRAEAIKGIQRHIDNTYYEETDGMLIALEMAIEALSEPEREKGEWIPVSERNPDIYKRVEKYLITDDEEQVRTTWFINSGEACWWGYSRVVAWQPLPEPYQKGGEE